MFAWVWVPISPKYASTVPYVLSVLYRFLPLISQIRQNHGSQHPRIHPIMSLCINYVFQMDLFDCGARFAALRVQNTLQRPYVLYVRTEIRKSSTIHGNWTRMTSDYITNEARMHNTWFVRARDVQNALEQKINRNCSKLVQKNSTYSSFLQ